MSFFGTVLVGAFVWNGDVCMFGRLKVGTPVPAEALFVCACCGRRIPWSERAASSGGGICQACFDERFTHCCICGRVLRQSEAHWRGADGAERPFCSGCLEAGPGAPIRPAERG